MSFRSENGLCRVSGIRLMKKVLWLWARGPFTLRLTVADSSIPCRESSWRVFQSPGFPEARGLGALGKGYLFIYQATIMPYFVINLV